MVTDRSRNKASRTQVTLPMSIALQIQSVVQTPFKQYQCPRNPFKFLGRGLYALGQTKWEARGLEAEPRYLQSAGVEL